MNRLYVVSGVDHDREELGGQVQQVADPESELVRSLAKSRAKHLATDLYETPSQERDVLELERSI